MKTEYYAMINNEFVVMATDKYIDASHNSNLAKTFESLDSIERYFRDLGWLGIVDIIEKNKD